MDDDRGGNQVDDENGQAFRSGRVRIIGAEPADRTLSVPAVGAKPDEPEAHQGDQGSPSVEPGPPPAGRVEVPDETELPHWTEAPTGEVPAVLARGGGAEEPHEHDPWSSMPAPTWREDGGDSGDAGEERFEPSMLANGEPGIGDRGQSDEAERQPWTFDLPGHEDPGHEDSGDGPVAGGVSEGGAGGASGATSARSVADEETLVAPIESLNEAGRSSGTPAAGAWAPDDGPGSEPEAGWGADAPDEWEGEGEPLRRWRRRRRRPVHEAAVAGSATATVEAGQGGFDGDETARSGAGSGPHDPVRVADLDEGGVALAGDDPVVAGETGIDPPRGRAGPLRRPVSQVPPAHPGLHRPRPLRPPVAVRESAASSRNLPAAAATGAVLLVAVLIVFKLGTVLSAVVASGVVFLAAAETYAAFRKAGFHPATLLGLLASVSLMVATYNKGQAALPLVLVLLVVFTFLWFIGGVQPGAEPVQGAAATLLVFCWVGVFGSFAALLLDPTLFPHRHGIAFLLGAIVTSAACDVGALAVGNWLGRHPLAPTISPNKTWEGAIGGLVFSVLSAIVVVHFVHPWTLGKSVLLGVVVGVVSPIGDLCESLVKRHLGVKDMGRMLPGHGGLLDRIDGLLFVLPATYYLVKAVHLG